jgi:hypothetical protein
MGRELSTLLQKIIFGPMDTRLQIAAQVKAAVIPSMVTIMKPLRQTTQGEAKQTDNYVQQMVIPWITHTASLTYLN